MPDDRCCRTCRFWLSAGLGSRGNYCGNRPSRMVVATEHPAYCEGDEPVLWTTATLYPLTERDDSCDEWEAEDVPSA